MRKPFSADLAIFCNRDQKIIYRKLEKPLRIQTMGKKEPKQC